MSLTANNATDSNDQTLVVIKGATDNTSIGNVSDSLKVTSRISDGTNDVDVSNNGDLNVSDGLSQGGVYGNLNLVTANTTYEAKVGASRLTDRKSLTITALNDMYWGYNSSVTTSTGTPLANNQQIVFAINPDSTFQVWLVASANNKNARITESP